MSSLLVYHHAYTSPNHDTITMMSAAELSTLLATGGPRTTHTTLKLARGASTVAIRQMDLLTASERDAHGEKPNMRNVVATLRIPWHMRVGRRWDVLHIVSLRAASEL